MTQDVDYIISLLKELTTDNGKKGSKDELGEQDAAPAGGGGGTSNTNKRAQNWDELYATVRGPANMLGKKGEKWDSGIKRGNANQVW
jgi:hypothetical protein